MTNENTNIELTDHTEANSNSNDHDDTEADVDDSVPDAGDSDVGEQTDDSVDAEHYRDVEMRQFSAVSGFPADFGYRFPITKPLGLVGVTVDDLRDGTEAMLYFGEPDAEQSVLTAALIVGEDLPTGHKDDRYRRIQNNGTSLVVYLKTEEIRAMGIDVEEMTPETNSAQIESLPVLDIWASEDGIAFRQLDVREVVVNKELNHAVEALPKQMAQDYLAIEEWGYDYSEWAKERRLTPMEEASGVFDRAAYIKRNVEEAKRRIAEYGDDGDHDEGEDDREGGSEST